MVVVAKSRIFSLDLLRGLVMIIMALDHTRDFFHYDAFIHDPLDLKTTSLFLFFTRWVTHFCAPIFVFLAGTSIYLQGNKKTKSELSLFLFKRGLWLIFVELIIITYAWTFDAFFPVLIMQVIWAIGISMVLMAMLIHLPYSIMLLLGFIVVAGHNVLDYLPATHQGFLWDIVRNGNFAFHTISAQHQMAIIYPFLPWLGLMMLGFCFGKIYAPSFNPKQRKNILTWTGAGLILFFVFLRFTNLYGNPTQWSIQNNVFFTFLSFINLNKYPPSLLYMCITIGPAMLFLSFFENTHNKITRIISVYGRVPFFYYVLHFYLLHILCMVLFLTRGHSLSEVTPNVFGIPFHYLIAGEGYPLTIVYLIWISLILVLYPLCKWFSELKARKNYWWLSYL